MNLIPNNNVCVLTLLQSARKIADYASSIGATDIDRRERPVTSHLGAVLADSVLQAGLNYRTVVKPRIERIITAFPEAENMAGICRLIEDSKVSNFLMWSHPDKIDRFINLARLLENENIYDAQNLKHWLLQNKRRIELLKIPGIGPKTVDYLSCLVGIDCIAVDRHVRVFVKDAGVDIKDYEEVRLSVSYAADLLGISRRGFDSWIWHFFSLKQAA